MESIVKVDFGEVFRKIFDFDFSLKYSSQDIPSLTFLIISASSSIFFISFSSLSKPNIFL